METSGGLGSLGLENDLNGAGWVRSNVRDFNEFVVGSQVPACFPAYARILHPACRVIGSAEHEVRWADIARATGHALTPGTSWEEIVGDADADPPSQGSLPRQQRAVLAEILERHTITAESCWFAVWDGFGYLKFETHGLPTLDMPARPMVLFSGPLSAVMTSFAEPPWEQSASLWWPNDRAWCVTTDVDLESTYIGASDTCINAIVGDERLEALRVSADDPLA